MWLCIWLSMLLFLAHNTGTCCSMLHGRIFRTLKYTYVPLPANIVKLFLTIVGVDVAGNIYCLVFNYFDFAFNQTAKFKIVWLQTAGQVCPNQATRVFEFPSHVKTCLDHALLYFTMMLLTPHSLTHPDGFSSRCLHVNRLALYMYLHLLPLKWMQILMCIYIIYVRLCRRPSA